MAARGHSAIEVVARDVRSPSGISTGMVRRSGTVGRSVRFVRHDWQGMSVGAPGGHYLSEGTLRLTPRVFICWLAGVPGDKAVRGRGIGGVVAHLRRRVYCSWSKRLSPLHVHANVSVCGAPWQRPWCGVRNGMALLNVPCTLPHVFEVAYASHLVLPFFCDPRVMQGVALLYSSDNCEL